MNVVQTDVLIVGAGPSGLIAACALARAGVAFHLIDKMEERSPHSRALVVHLRSLEIFDQLGVAEKLLGEGNAVRGLRMHFGGKLRLEVDFSEQRYQGCRFRDALFVEQNRTEAALDACLDRLGAQPLFNHELIEFEEGEDGVLAGCRDGQDRPYRVECRYVVGCDGAHSVVRQQKQIPFSGSAYAEDFMLADVDLDWSQSRENFQAFIDRDGLLVLLPMRQKVRLVAARGRYRPQSGVPTLEEFQALMARLVPYEARISNPAWIARFHLHHRIAKRFRAGRVCLAGDAAHIHSPVGGQGMNTGIQDAWNLGWKLAWALGTRHRHHADELLDTYHEERHPVGKQLIGTTDRAFTFLAGQSWSSRFIRTFIGPWLLPTLGSFGSLRRRALFRITQLGVHYRGRKLSGPDPDGRHFTRTLVPGDRMPDLQVGDTSLHRALDATQPTILCVGVQDHERREGCKFLHLPNASDVDRELLGLKDHGLFLIRPDGHLAARAVSMQGLRDSPLLRLYPG